MVGKPSAAAGEDRGRLLESRHDIDAVRDPAAVSSDPLRQAGISRDAGELAVARATLLSQVSYVTREGRETAEARIGVGGAREYAVAQLLFVRDLAAQQTRVDPDAPHDDDATAAHKREIAALYSYNSESIRRLGPDALLPIIETLVPQVSADPSDGSAHSRLTRAKARLKEALELLNAETDEDRAAYDQLRDARAQFDRAARVHALGIEAALLRSGREGELGRFIKAQDPAYAARRRASAPIEAEPGIDTINAEAEAEADALPSAPTA